jgi:hypothetical protein
MPPKLEDDPEAKSARQPKPKSESATFLTLPRELRQSILRMTYSRSYKACHALRQKSNQVYIGPIDDFQGTILNPSPGYGATGERLLENDYLAVKKWAETLKVTERRIAEDVDYVFPFWVEEIKELIDGWKGMKDADLLMEVWDLLYLWICGSDQMLES